MQNPIKYFLSKGRDLRDDDINTVIIFSKFELRDCENPSSYHLSFWIMKGHIIFFCISLKPYALRIFQAVLCAKFIKIT